MTNPSKSESSRGFYAAHWGKLWAAQAVVLLVIGFVVGISLAWNLQGTPVADTHAAAADTHADAPEKWTCSMHPQIQRDGPGKCPICDMPLVPVSSSSAGIRTITISPTARKLMRIETTPVQRRYVTAEVRMVGKVEFDETKVSHITAWVSGRLDRLYVDYTGIQVKPGDHLVYIYSEELYAAQEELIQAIKYQRERPPTTTTIIQPIDMVASAREKLRLLGMTADQINEIQQRRTPADHVTIYSPIGGIVIEKLRQEGDRVRTGDRIYTVADLTQVWVKLDAYESDLQWLRYGQEVEFTTVAYAGETFTGRVAFIDPVLNKDTRTVKVRVNVPNEDGRLKPEMFVRAVVRSQVASGGRVLDASLVGKWISPMHPEIVKDEPGNCDICGMPLVRAETLGYVTAQPNDEAKPLVIPVSAALLTGRRAIVYVEDPTAEQPTFDGREIVLGPRAGAFYLVRQGLEEGELVVTNGNFKLDSALQIEAKPSMMTPDDGGGGGHDHEADHEPRIITLDVPPAFQAQLARLWQTYQPIGEALAADDLAAARQGIGQLQPALASIDAGEIEGDVSSAWQREQANLEKIVSDLSEAADIEAARLAFVLLSDEMIALVKSFGVGDVGPIFELHCPMAFKGRGASWLQNNDQTRNPYFGATMLKCADRVDLISSNPMEQPPAEHEEHDHNQP